MKAERKLAFRALCAAAWIAAVATAQAADLQADTAVAFDRYVGLTEMRLNQEKNGTIPFLWVDRLLGAQRHDADARLYRGEVLVRRMETREAGRSIDIPGGLCHHWVGTVFVPGVTLDRTLALMQAYNSYQDTYRPAVRRSTVLSRDGDRFKVALQLFMKKVVSVVLDTEYDVSYVRVSAARTQVRSVTTRIAEVQHPGTFGEQERPVGHDSGFLWRFNNYCALEERDHGTYVQCESVSLSREIPMGLGWLIGPFVTGIPREALEFTLATMRQALTAGHERAAEERPPGETLQHPARSGRSSAGRSSATFASIKSRTHPSSSLVQ